MVLRKLVFVWTLTSLFKDTAGTVCSDAVTDGTTVLNMCEDGYADGDHVVIDTYGSSVYRKDGGSINCSCTATVIGLPDGTFTTVGYGPVQSLYPTSPCGSSVIISAQLAAFLVVSTNKYLCTVTSNTINLVQTNDTVTVVWQSGLSGSTSGYCLSLRAGVGSSLSTKCDSFGTTHLPTSSSTTTTTTKPTATTTPTTTTPTTTTPTTTTPTTTTPTTTTPTTTTPTTTTPTTTTTTPTTAPTTTITSTIDGRTNGGGTMTSSAKPTTNTEATTYTAADKIIDENLDTTVIIAIAAGGVVFLVICIVIAVMCSRTKRKSNKHRETESAVNHNVLYEVTGVYSPDTTTNHVVTPSGDIYAQVERHSKVETTHSQEQPHEPEQEKEHVMTPSGDLYAQVKKHPKAETSNSKQQSDKPELEIEHVTTPSGDIYAQVERHSKVKTAVL